MTLRAGIPLPARAISLASLWLWACTSDPAAPAGGAGSGRGAASDPAPALPDSSARSPLELSRFASSLWCPGCTDASNGGDTTDFGGQRVLPAGCSVDYTTSETSVAEALASGADLSLLPVGLDEQFEADVHWREQDRSSRLTVTARLDERITLTRSPPLEAGEARCPSWARGTVHVTLDADDGSIAGSFATDRINPPLYAPSLELAKRWSAEVQLQGNLELAPDPTRTPLGTTLFFQWFRTSSDPADRVGITLQLDYQEQAVTSECGTTPCSFEFLAVATPPDGCAPNELPSGGACVEFSGRSQ